MSSPRVITPPPVLEPRESREQGLEAARRERLRRVRATGRFETILGGQVGTNPPFRAAALGG